MIGIIGAMSMEVDGLIANMTDLTECTICGVKFCSGKLFGRDVVVALSGVGKVNAAVCTAYMIENYKPCAVINIGVGGGVGSGLRQGDIVVADKVVMHDYDLTALGNELGRIDEFGSPFMPVDIDMSNRLARIAEQHAHTVRGTVAGGDKFVSSAEDCSALRERFGVKLCDMESAAIAQVAIHNSVPYAIVRAVSDGADDGAALDYQDFAKVAARKSINIVIQYIKSL